MVLAPRHLREMSDVAPSRRRGVTQCLDASSPCRRWLLVDFTSPDFQASGAVAPCSQTPLQGSGPVGSRWAPASATVWIR